MSTMPVINIFLGGESKKPKEEKKEKKDSLLAKVLKDKPDDGQHKEVMGGFKSLFNAISGLPHSEHSGGTG